MIYRQPVQGVGDAYGHGKIELFERDRKVEDIPFDNFIGPVGVAYQKWMNRRTFNVPLLAHTTTENNNWEWMSPATYDYRPQDQTTGAGDPEPVFPFSGLVITTNAAAEDPVNERSHKGMLIGWANRRSYTGSSTTRGSVNSTLQLNTAALVRHVFDWPTHAANGTFRSVGWAALQQNVSGSTQPNAPSATITARRTFTNHTSLGGGNGLYGVFYDPSDDSIVAYSYNTALRRRAWGDGTSTIDWGSPNTDEVTTLASLSNNMIAGLTRIGNEWFASAYYDTTAYVYAVGTGTLTRLRTFPLFGTNESQNTHNNKVLGTDGTNLLAARVVGANIEVHRRSPTDGSLVQQYTVPSYGYALIRGITYDSANDHILVLSQSTSSSVLIRIDRTTGVEASRSASWWGDVNGGLMLRSGKVYVFNTTNAYEFVEDNLGTRTLLGAPVTKTDAQTMRITYQFDFS